jgi:ADP-ribosylglycohydrolase
MSELFKRIHGCEAAGTIANAMGDPVEGMPWEKIEAEYGFFDQFLAQDKPERVRPQVRGIPWQYHAHHRVAGTTEDGMERHKLCTSAIIKKGGRISIEDLANAWLTEVDPEKIGYLLTSQDLVIYTQIRHGVPPWEVGRNASWPEFIGTTKMIQPVGMVNACNPRQAGQDALEIGQIKDVRGTRGNYALEVCAGVAAGTAEALRPSATTASVIDRVLSYLTEVPLAEVNDGLDRAKAADSWKDLRPYYAERYEGCPGSNAVEVLSGALACFYLADGHPKDAILYSINIGRDTDCKAYVAGGMAGALRGIEAIPEEWVDIVDEAARNDPWSVSNRTTGEAAEGLHRAARNELEKMREVIGEMEALHIDH